MNAYVVGTGIELPEHVVTNQELAKRLDIDAERIFKTSGIRERRWAGERTSTSSLAAAALSHAMEAAHIGSDEIDYLIMGTMTPDRFIPGSSPIVQSALKLRDVPCLDIRAACCNGLYALQLGRALLKAGIARTIGVCLAEVQSPLLDLSPRSATTTMLFGDGAAAFVLANKSRSHALEVMDVTLATDGSFADDLGVRAPGSAYRSNCEDKVMCSLPRMNGQSVILQASRKMVSASRSLLERNNLSALDIDWIVPHQANANLLAQVVRGIGACRSRSISVLDQTGNTSSAGMGIALDRLMKTENLTEGDFVLLPAFGAGFTWGCGLCRVV